MNANTMITHAAMREGARSADNMLRTVAGWWGAMMRRRQAQRAERFLLSQPEHLLRDIGIARSEITAVVHGAIER